MTAGLPALISGKQVRLQHCATHRTLYTKSIKRKQNPERSCACSCSGGCGSHIPYRRHTLSHTHGRYGWVSGLQWPGLSWIKLLTTRQAARITCVGMPGGTAPCRGQTKLKVVLLLMLVVLDAQLAVRLTCQATRTITLINVPTTHECRLLEWCSFAA